MNNPLPTVVSIALFAVAAAAQPAPTLIADLNPGIGSSLPKQLTSFRGQVWFVATLPGTNHGLWRSDGTTAGTVQVPGIDLVTQLRVVGDLLFIVGRDTTTFQNGLFRSDGSSLTFLTAVGVFPDTMVPFAGKAWFLGGGGGIASLWSSDGTSGGTVAVAPVAISTFGATLVATSERLYYVATDAANGFEPQQGFRLRGRGIGI
jgi:ELWxxDGT repeat protein